MHLGDDRKQLEMVDWMRGLLSHFTTYHDHELASMFILHVGFKVSNGFGMWMLCEYFEAPKKVWRSVVGLKPYDGLLAPKLTSLSSTSLPSNPECAQFLWRVIG